MRLANHGNGQTEVQDVESKRLLISAEHLARLLDISVRTLWRLRSAGKLPDPIRIGGSVRWNAQEIDEWIAEGCPTTN
jgi:excisionase family DNA binding protein